MPARRTTKKAGKRRMTAHRMILARHAAAKDGGATFDYTPLSGLDPQRYTIALRGIEIEQLEDGEAAPVIPNVVGLHYLIAVCLLGEAGTLDGSAVKFLRKVLQMRQVDFAELVGLRAETLSRWETGAETPREDSQILVRLRVLVRILEAPEVYRRLSLDSLKALVTNLSERVANQVGVHPDRLELVLSGAPTWEPEHVPS